MWYKCLVAQIGNKTTWPSGLRRYVKAVVFIGEGSNPSVVIFWSVCSIFINPRYWCRRLLPHRHIHPPNHGFAHPDKILRNLGFQPVRNFIVIRTAISSVERSVPLPTAIITSYDDNIIWNAGFCWLTQCIWWGGIESVIKLKTEP